MHIGILYVNAWDAISAYDFACIDRFQLRTLLALTLDGQGRHKSALVQWESCLRFAEKPAKMHALTRVDILYANARDAIGAHESMHSCALASRERMHGMRSVLMNAC